MLFLNYYRTKNESSQKNYEAQLAEKDQSLASANQRF